MFRAAVLTISDSSFAGMREDQSGPVICDILGQAGYLLSMSSVFPDEQTLIEQELVRICDQGLADLILTTGGTGFAPRDVTPEATKAVYERDVPGIPEAMRAYSQSITPRAMLSRAAAGIRKKTLIINLPGSPKAVRECLEYILPTLEHGLHILLQTETNCAQK